MQTPDLLILAARSKDNKFRGFLSVAAASAAILIVTALPVAAQHRARLSADLADHLAADSPVIDVIVDGDRAAVDRLARQYNVVTVRSLSKGGAVLRMNAGQLAAIQQDDAVEHLAGNIRYKSSAVDTMTEGIGADQVWAGTGSLGPVTGRGVTVAVVDSGFDPKHFALKNRTLAVVDFTGGDGVDQFGHGTHVAGLIAGQPGRTPDTRIYQGVAPGAYLVNLRVLGADGSGVASDVIEAIDWAVDHRDTYNIRVINLSLGAPVLQPYRDDPVCAAVERAVRAGIVVVAAAGNYGQTTTGVRVLGGIASPGNSPYAITVGALDTNGTAERSDDVVAPFSSSGPTRYDLVMKPDLVAPGRRVTSAEAVGSLLSVNFPDRHVAGSGPNSYIRGSGTSMATAIVSGAAALLLEERSGMQPLTTKAALQLTSTFLPASGLVQGGAGSLNVLAAAEFVRDGDLEDTTIVGETVSASQIMFAPVSQLSFTGGVDGMPALGNRDTLVWVDSNTLVWGNSDTLVWGNASTLVWGNSQTLVWGNGDTLVWGNGNTLVWGNSNTLVWGNSNTLVWGNSDTLVWGNSDTLVWGNSDTVIWGNSDTVIWGNSDTVIWGNSDTVIWGNSDTLVWGN
jgi:serine protease AprX